MSSINTSESIKPLYKESYSNNKKKKIFQKLKKCCSEAKKKQC